MARNKPNPTRMQNKVELALYLIVFSLLRMLQDWRILPSASRLEVTGPAAVARLSTASPPLAQGKIRSHPSREALDVSVRFVPLLQLPEIAASQVRYEQGHLFPLTGSSSDFFQSKILSVLIVIRIRSSLMDLTMLRG